MGGISTSPPTGLWRRARPQRFRSMNFKMAKDGAIELIHALARAKARLRPGKYRPRKFKEPTRSAAGQIIAAAAEVIAGGTICRVTCVVWASGSGTQTPTESKTESHRQPRPAR